MALNLVDVVMTFFVLVCLLVLAPFFNTFTGMLASSAGPLSSLLLALVLPFLFISLIVSVGVSARRR